MCTYPKHTPDCNMFCLFEISLFRSYLHQLLWQDTGTHFLGNEYRPTMQMFNGLHIYSLLIKCSPRRESDNRGDSMFCWLQSGPRKCPAVTTRLCFSRYINCTSSCNGILPRRGRWLITEESSVSYMNRVTFPATYRKVLAYYNTIMSLRPKCFPNPDFQIAGTTLGVPSAGSRLTQIQATPDKEKNGTLYG